jgi:acetyl esterase/lipase
LPGEKATIFRSEVSHPLVMSASCFSRYLIVFAALTISFSAVQAQQPNRDPRQQAVVYRLPNMDQISVQRDITFKNVGDLRLKMDVYYPADVKKDERRPVVVFIDGVGNRSDRPNFKDWGQYRDWGNLVAASGLAAINYDSRGEEAVADASSLLEYIRANAAKLSLDENRILIWACSANGRAGVKIAMEVRPYIRAAVFYYAASETPSLLRELPLFIARAGLDSASLNQGLDHFTQTAVAQGLFVSFINYPEGHHAFDLVDNTDESREIIKRTLDFIKFQLVQNNRPQASRAPSPARFIAVVNALGWTKALEIYEQAKRDEPQAALFTEQSLNGVGYSLLQNKKTKEALEVFKLIVASYPNSANAYDSLGDAYEADNNKAESIKSAERAIELLDKDTNLPAQLREQIRQSANQKLQRLKGN